MSYLQAVMLKTNRLETRVSLSGKVLMWDTTTFQLMRLTKVKDEGEEMGCSMNASLLSLYLH